MKTIAVILLLMLLGAGAWATFSRLDTNDTMRQTVTPMEQDSMSADGDMNADATMEDEQVSDDAMMGDSGKETMAENGRYVVYSPEAYEQGNDGRRVLFFYAAWCPTCRPADAEFEARADEIPEDVTLYRVNYDTEEALKEQYDITYQHTYVEVDEAGNEVAKWNGGAMDELLSNIQ